MKSSETIHAPLRSELLAAAEHMLTACGGTSVEKFQRAAYYLRAAVQAERKRLGLGPLS